MKHIIRSLAAFLLGMQVAIQIRSRGLVAAANTYDAAIEVHDDSIRRTAEAAITARHLLVKQGTAATQVNLCGASDVPLGTVDNIVAIDEAVTVLLLGKGKTKKMVASGAISAGVRVYAAAGGKVSASGTVPAGTSITAAGADNDIIEVADGVAVATPSGTSHKIVAAGIHDWAGGAATTDSIAVVGLLSTDVVQCTLVARASTETLALAVNDHANDQIDLTLSANGTNTTTKVAYSVLRAA